MGTKHTPGPLVVCVNSLDGHISIQQDREHFDEEPIITVDCVDDMGEGLGREIGFANAYLYAAAPDLLAVAKKLHLSINGLNATMRSTSPAYSRTTLCQELSALIAENAAAIARAEAPQ